MTNDHPQLSQDTTIPWTQTLRVGDVVAFAFPHESEGADAPKCRPSLVLELERIGDEIFAELAYGTSRPRPVRASYAISVGRREELAAASLDRPTSFDTSRRVKVALSHSGFDVHSKFKTPVLGRLTGRSEERMQRVRAGIHANHDIRRSRLFGRSRPRTVTVGRRARGKRTVQELRNV